MRRIFLVLVSALLCACGGSSSPTTASGPPQDESDDWGEDWQWEDEAEAESGSEEVEHRSAIEILGGINPPPTPWAEMSYEEREYYMVGIVNPISAEMIQEHDAARGAGFGCASCHGSDMRERNFAMPSTQRMPVPPAGTPEYEAMRQSFGPIIPFMEEHFTGQVGRLMGIEDFTCNSCHPTTG